MSANLRFHTTLHEYPDSVIQLQGLLSRQKQHHLIRLSKPSSNLGVLPGHGRRHNKSHISNRERGWATQAIKRIFQLVRALTLARASGGSDDYPNVTQT
ncbi:hypothetical protein CY34DRAFT_812398 [Suillus luteus UH-Slu-Lm8-n1]|uniref:Uncharacterized protein n=1 Tax=Suillus luteus UH-Slu-Lm8-n1 TaxID=930992 RepID=A0A0D0ALI5_9AGAM|nr:hypothetical protein CY34DRAFT_812398 [Suillus luteus UH-Slu-Lm8-n1]